MISMGDIRKREMYLNMKNILYEYNIQSLLENCKNTTSINIIEIYFKNWPYNRNENYYEFTEAANILEGFINRSKRKSDSDKAINLFTEMVLPKTINLKSAKNVLKSLDNIPIELLEECDKYIICDRILNNHKKLVKKGINNIMQESILLSNDGIDDCTTSICEFIDNIDMPFPIKYNVALENILYILDMHGIHYDRKNILESVNDYFFINIDEEKLKMMNTILKENKLYLEADKKETLKNIGKAASVGVLTFLIPPLGGIYILPKVYIHLKKHYLNSTSYKNKKPGAKLYTKQSTLDLYKQNCKKGEILENLKSDKYTAITNDDTEYIEAAKDFAKTLQKSNPKYEVKYGINHLTDPYDKNKYIVLWIDDRYSTYQVSILAKKDKCCYIIPFWCRDNGYNIIECKTKSHPNYHDYKNESVYADKNNKDDNLDIILDSDDDDDLDISIENNIDTLKSKVKEKSNHVLSELKTLPDKTPESIKKVIKKLYTKSPDNIIEETPNFLIWMRKFLLFSTITIPVIGPYIAIVGFFADQAIQFKLQSSETEKMIKSFKHEKDKCEKKIAKCKSDKQRDVLKKYIKELEKDISKLEDYEDTLYTEKENEERFEKKMSESVEFEFENYITLKEYIDNYHSKVVQQMYILRSQLESYLKSKYKKIYETQCILLTDKEELMRFENGGIKIIPGYIASSDNKIYIDIAKFLGIRYKELNDTIVDQKDILSDICDNLQLNLDYNFCLLYDGSEDMYTIQLSFNLPILLDDGSDNVIEEQVHNSILKSCAMILALEESVSKISEKDMDYLLSFVDDNIDQLDMATVDCIGQFSVVASDIISPKAILDLFEEKANDIRYNEKDNSKYIKLSKLQEGIDSINNSKPIYNKYISIYDTYDNIQILSESMDLIKQITINETSFANTMKMVQQRLKNNIKKLSDKEKQTSRELDYAVDSMVDKLQRSVTNNNREAVIKGSIIPSASKIIKIAITTTATYAVSPAIAVIGVLGGIAASKNATSKERQYILDEIDIQMKVVDKKIQLADRSDDMDAMEELLKIQQKLKKEKSRIEYHKKDYVPVRKDD